MTPISIALEGAQNKEKLPSVINNPFSKSGVMRMMIVYVGEMSPTYWYAKIEFQNGLTKGEQRTPNCANFDEVMQHIKAIEESLNNHSHESKP